MENYKIVDEKIMSGYDHIKSGETIKACDIWLEAWEGVKELTVEAGVKDIDELQKKYKWSDFLSNYVQDLESELNNAGVENKEYFQKRIQYCSEMLELCGKTDGLIVENTRRAVADSHFELGNEQECDRLYSMWLEEDPNWGWGYIGWSDCYQFRKNKTKEYLEKAETIITKALNEKGLRDRLDVDERAVEIFRAIGNEQKVAELEKEIPTLSRYTFPDTFPETVKNSPINVEKTGRNDPCPCGSGKKYKKCCGKS